MHTKKYILVVGGAGFIGSQMTLSLNNAGFSVVILDRTIPQSIFCKASDDWIFISGDINDKQLLNKIFSKYLIFAIMHFAALIDIEASWHFPNRFYENNVVGTLNLLNAMIAYEIKHIIFSSTAAVYGEPQYLPIDEAHPLAPINPYGRTKQMAEEMIQDYAEAFGINYTIFRYFNAAGADPHGRCGENHEPESHLIPRILTIAKNPKTPFFVFGNDYQTPDGTCIRDYIHVVDLCDAHLSALLDINQNPRNQIYNLGAEKGFSVLEVIEATRLATGLDVPYQVMSRRVGDPAILIADAAKAQKELGWQAKYPDLKTIVGHAWQYMQLKTFASNIIINA